MESRARRIYPGWIIVAVTSLVLLVTAGSRAAPGALLVEMEADTGYSNTSLSIAAALGLLVYGIGGPFAGSLMGRIGPRRVTLMSIAITAVGMVVASQADSLGVLILFFGFVTGLGAGLVASVLGAVVATRWFVEKRGLVLGIFGASISAGGLIFFPLLTKIGVDSSWRTALIVVAGVSALLFIPAFIWFRDNPSDLGVEPLGAVGETDTSAPPEQGVMRRAVHSKEFWLLVTTFFVCGATSNGLVGQHFISHAKDHGFDQVTAANWLGIMGVFNFIGTIGSGWLTDRYDPRKLLLAYYGFRGVSLMFLPFVHDSISIGAFAILFGLDYIATVPPTIALCADLFGSRNAGLVYGWVFAAHQVGAAGAAWAAGAARDGLGDYNLAFMSAGIVAIAAGVAATMIRQPDTISPAA